MDKPVTAVLGLGRDVGAAIARRLTEAGHDIMIADADQAKIDEAVDGLTREAATHHGDLHTRLGLRNCLATALEAYGRIDNVVIVPPIPKPSDLMGLDMEGFDKALARSSRGAVLALRIFSEHFASQEDLPGAAIERARQKGTITFILKLTAQFSNPGQFTESVTQHAILGVMRAGAVELATSDVRCNAVVAIRPRAEEDEPWVRTRTPLRRAATADEIADAAIYLASPESAIITGQTLVLDGGRSVLGGVLE
ncbi:MAG: SDR family oxidoreductase [Hyphomonadaceae bacterium]